MPEYDITTYPEGYKKAMETALDFLPEEQREEFMFGLMCFIISC